MARSAEDSRETDPHRSDSLLLLVPSYVKSSQYQGRNRFQIPWPNILCCFRCCLSVETQAKSGRSDITVSSRCARRASRSILPGHCQRVFLGFAWSGDVDGKGALKFSDAGRPVEPARVHERNLASISWSIAQRLQSDARSVMTSSRRFVISQTSTGTSFTFERISYKYISSNYADFSGKLCWQD